MLFSFVNTHAQAHAFVCTCTLIYPLWQAFAGYLDICKKVERWRKLKALHRLLEPFKVAIHALEADKALLSQVWKVSSLSTMLRNHCALNAQVAVVLSNGTFDGSLNVLPLGESRKYSRRFAVRLGRNGTVLRFLPYF